MKFADVQTALSAKLSASATLAALGSPVILSLFTDDATSKAAINAALASHGVVFGIGYVSGSRDEDSAGRWTDPRANLTVFVEESITVAHSPASLALVDTVIAAVTHRDGYDFDFVSLDSMEAESGNVLHAISFSCSLCLP
jgi:hypothetical protein